MDSFSLSSFNDSASPSLRSCSMVSSLEASLAIKSFLSLSKFDLWFNFLVNAEFSSF